MAVTLGKRKRYVESREDEAEVDLDAEARALFQRAFEAKFNALEKPVVISQPEVEEDDSEELDGESEGSDWGGLSDGGDVAVQVIDHGISSGPANEMTRDELRAFMSSKPPSAAKVVKSSKLPANPKTADNDDDEGEAGNLKHDLALQRLLKESHLLDASTFSGPSAAPEGKSRLKALDLRLKDLGAKKDASEQVKMPLSHRRGIVAKATSREASRRKNATENGIILEKAKSTFKAPAKRERAVAVPSVGKFRGGTLKLSERDVKSIEGPKKRAGGKGRRR
ncbi:pre-rRNA processing and 40S ribosomal subunit assembly [Recurvomyces mirabilis]|uniref:Pre-rRNA processing and 40S ribosomal subunit assembly n=1 Tax=Recurvomyces mirabilis TaxID=574656 RepID=A0AAE0WRH3_9PEZI|nr:pre-rRNA processing and 40S ribosomal subunit assembly [Recurvomyces mirabilis]KAK5154866.1 pre-rRNA processing and 40S ribosomal subunit assembly [Recurvomyces mirabilis]